MKVILAKKIILENKILEGYGVYINDGRIESIVPQDSIDLSIVEQIPLKADYLLPGFIDIHIHGSAGSDVMDATPEALNAIQKSLATTGTTSFLGTTMTVDFNNIERALEQIRLAMSQKEIIGAKLIGAHLEGPFINAKAKGAHLENHIKLPEIEAINAYADVIKLITIAPEMDVSNQFIKSARALGIHISLGHSTCSYDCAKSAIEAGAESITHLFNAMTGLHHRDPGLVGAAFLTDVYTELIADNVHVHPDLYELVYKLKGSERMILITDAMKGQCMKAGQYDLGGQTVVVGDKDARLENGVLAGSILTQNKSLKHMIRTKGLDIVKVSRMLSANPAQLLGLTDIGSIRSGSKADFALLDSHYDLLGTVVEGKLF